jgi:hypothetical protein
VWIGSRAQPQERAGSDNRCTSACGTRLARTVQDGGGASKCSPALGPKTDVEPK